ncbi:conserved integral membrane protein [Mycobacterium tuberculosis EAS054]|nr:conserved integral membrane protein [Mycobacterium tuberculosis EAS054]
MCTLAAVASVLGIVDPPRKSRTKASEQELASPYRGSSILWRIHAASALLMMPQTVTVTFMLVWLINHHGWSVAQAGVLVTISQLLGALGRVAVGRWSDHVGSRMRPVRLIAAAAAATLFLLAAVDNEGSRYDVLLMIALSVIAVLDNGLEATRDHRSTPGPLLEWAGRLGIPETLTQRLMAGRPDPPLFGKFWITPGRALPGRHGALCGVVSRLGAVPPGAGSGCSPPRLGD